MAADDVKRLVHHDEIQLQEQPVVCLLTALAPAAVEMQAPHLAAEGFKMPAGIAVGVKLKERVVQGIVAYGLSDVGSVAHGKIVEPEDGLHPGVEADDVTGMAVCRHRAVLGEHVCPAGGLPHDFQSVILTERCGCLLKDVAIVDLHSQPAVGPATR